MAADRALMDADIGQSSTVPPASSNDKPLVVRVKRKAFHSPLEGFWLEISERPLKRPLVDFEKLSLSDSSGKGLEISETPLKRPLVDFEKLSQSDSSGKEVLRTRRVFVKRVDTVRNSEVTVEALQSYVQPPPNGVKCRENSSRQRQSLSTQNKHDQLLSKARQHQEVLAHSARFEQIWRKRRQNEEGLKDEALNEVCRVYDVVRLDDDDETPQVEKQHEQMSKEDAESLSSFLPLLRELVPDAADQIEHDLLASKSGQGGYVYDLYTVGETIGEAQDSRTYPLIQVNDDDDWYDGPDDTDYETDDSNAENNPLNDYPEEVSDEEEEEKEDETSAEGSDEDMTGSDESASTSSEDRVCPLIMSKVILTEDEDNDYYDNDYKLVNGSYNDMSEDDGEDW